LIAGQQEAVSQQGVAAQVTGMLWPPICDIRGRLANRPEFPPAGSRQELISFRTPNTQKF
jgi:hypothetical protein